MLAQCSAVLPSAPDTALTSAPAKRRSLRLTASPLA
eukprot:CAMPEP_0114164646 /NCGR_PEP_ID=MMETSP0043_2-20121206/30782_1 /TAXON_ID=464988 /ORGANISM="Hemiselmis andersenii, Strain CCMP644" /LENGTH=35 /DNA_ID= /DNA_START= /DNA_END= /DNA_ORIENTATION=